MIEQPESLLTHLFFSYSHTDRDFVAKLAAALKARDRDVWVDWKDIPPTAEWLEKIKKGIERSRAFLFILSPNSLRSEVCSQELEHAVLHKKRIIPIVCRSIEGI